MTDSLVIKSGDGLGELILTLWETNDVNRRLDYFVVTIRSASLEASRQIYNYHYADATMGFAPLFAEMAANWKGWSGEKRWESVEGDFKLSCEHDGLSSVRLTVELTSYFDHEWSVSCLLKVALGDLDSIANDVKKFFQYEA